MSLCDCFIRLVGVEMDGRGGASDVRVGCT